jgi:hypothetical protein
LHTRLPLSTRAALVIITVLLIRTHIAARAGGSMSFNTGIVSGTPALDRRQNRFGPAPAGTPAFSESGQPLSFPAHQYTS